jgi:hypothetical protein
MSFDAILHRFPILASAWCKGGVSTFICKYTFATEYTQSDNCRFLAYITSRWKNQPWVVRVGGERPPPFTLFTITYKVAMFAPAERAYTLPRFHLYPLFTLWSLQLCNIHKENLLDITCDISFDVASSATRKHFMKTHLHKQNHSARR